MTPMTAHAGITVVPPEATQMAVWVDDLTMGVLAVCMVLTLAVFVLVLYFSWRYRAGSPRPRGRPPARRTTHWVEGAAVLSMLALFMIFFYWGTRLYIDEYRGPKDVTTIDVVGKQWMWKIHYANGAREINRMHVPVGDVVRLDITSEDVIHSFYIPAFRLKHDAVPGMTTHEWFRAILPGTYRIFCAEFCGTNHARMTGEVVVMPREDFARWLDARARPQSSAASASAASGKGGDDP